MDWELFSPLINEFINPSRRLYWPYLVMAFVMAVSLFLVRREDGLRSLFDSPEKKQSLRTDVLYFMANQLIFAALFLPWLVHEKSITDYFIEAGVLEFSVLYEGSSLALNLVLSFILLIIFDGTMFLVHWAMHRIPVLWSFHKVHHGAEALNPLTAHRSHPLEIALTTFVLALTLGPSTACIKQLFPGYELFDVWGVNVFLGAFYFFGYNLRHSHVWLDYPSFLKLALISPAQHQVHHSVAQKHWNKNYGFIFSFWDRALGTLYSSKQKEDLQFGLAPGDQEKYRHLGQLYFEPFVDAAQCLRHKGRL